MARIAIVARTARGTTGQVRLVLDQARHLNGEGHEVAVVSERSTKDLPDNLNPKELPSSMISISSYEMLGLDFLHQQPFLIFHDGGIATGFSVHLVDDNEKKKFLDLAASTTYDSNEIKINARRILINQSKK